MGASDETIARGLHGERRALAERYKAATREPLRTALRERTIRIYGNRIGPMIAYLRARGKSWADIMEGATRPGPIPTIED